MFCQRQLVVQPLGVRRDSHSNLRTVYVLDHRVTLVAMLFDRLDHLRSVAQWYAPASNGLFVYIITNG